MRLLIELDNEKERILMEDKISKVKEIFDENVEIVFPEKGDNRIDIFDQLEMLQWDMGKKLYKTRDELHER